MNMGVRNALVSGLETFRKLIYRGPVKRLAAALGLESKIRTGYSWLLGLVSAEDTVTHDVGGISVSFRVLTGLEVQRFRNLMDESDVIESLLSEVTEDDVFYDVGANVGLYACFLSHIVDQTVAFEPHPANIQRLEENIELNNLSNVIVRREALSDTNGTAELAVSGGGIAGEGRHSLQTDSTGDTIEVESVRGDELLDDLPSPDVLKIDVEGAEMQVLRGFQNALGDDCRLCYVEIHPDRFENYENPVARIQSLFSDLGFSTNVIYERENDEHFLVARHEERN